MVGLGVQGSKRVRIAREDLIATVDPVIETAEFKSVEEVPLDIFDAALVCTPDAQKLEILSYLLNSGKHILVEKPLLGQKTSDLCDLKKLAELNSITCYTAYNHRFEPNIIRIKEVLDSGQLGNIYTASLFYGNGTAIDIKNSSWRDVGTGVLQDLGSHLLDITMFLFGSYGWQFDLWSHNRFETKALDHVVFASPRDPVVSLEATVLSWKNSFSVDIIGELGSVHMEGLCKWGPSTFSVRRRVFPSGVPFEQVETVRKPDPTWQLEYDYFKDICGSNKNSLDNDINISHILGDLANQAERVV